MTQVGQAGAEGRAVGSAIIAVRYPLIARIFTNCLLGVPFVVINEIRGLPDSLAALNLGEQRHVWNQLRKCPRVNGQIGGSGQALFSPR